LEVSLKTDVRVRDFENSKRKQIMSDLGKYKRAAKNDVAYNMMRTVGVAPSTAQLTEAIRGSRQRCSKTTLRSTSNSSRTNPFTAS
jgi:hypothetical protein